MKNNQNLCKNKSKKKWSKSFKNVNKKTITIIYDFI